MNNNTKPVILLGLVTIITLLFGLKSNVIGDSSLYASISKKIFTDGDLQNLFLLDKDYIQKPHMVFWLSTLSYKLFGISTLSFKLPSVLIALSGVLGIYNIGKILRNPTTGLYASIIWLFSLPMFLHLNDIHMDTMMSGFIIWTAYFWVRYLKDNKATYFLLGCIPVAFAAMTKGPLGLFVPVTGLVFAFLIKGRFRQLFSPYHFLGIATLLLLISPVLYFIYNQHNIEGLQFFFIGNNVSRIDSNSSFFDKDFSFYIHTLLWFFLPWALAGFYVLGVNIKRLFKKELPIELTFLLGSFLVFFTIASMSEGHAPHYIFTLLPFLSVLIAIELNQHAQSIKTISILVRIPTVIIGLAGLAVLFLFPPKEILHYIGITLMLLFFRLSFRIEDNTKQMLLQAGGTIALLFITLNIEVFHKYVDEFDGPTQAIEFIDNNYQVDKLYYIGSDHDASRADFYGTTPIQFYHFHEEITLPKEEQFYALVDKDGLAKFKSLTTDIKVIKKFENLRMTVPVNAFKKRLNKGYTPKYLYFIEK